MLVKVIDEDKGKLTEYLIGIWLLFGILTNTLLAALSGFEQFDLWSQYISFCSSFAFLSGNHVGYFILGRYLAKKSISKEMKEVLYVLGLLATIALYVLTDWYSHYSGYGDNRWLSTLNIFVVLQATALFIFFCNIKITGRYYSGIVSYLNKYTFGIYLIHVLFLDWSYRLKIFTENGIGTYEINPILNTPLRVVLIYGVSFICVFAMKKAILFLKGQHPSPVKHETLV